MKSLRYVFLGRATNLTDCLDYCTRRKPTRVFLSLRTRESLSEMHAVRSLVARLRWHDGNGPVTVEMCLGNCRSTDKLPLQVRAVEQANCCLADVIRQLVACGAVVRGSERRFSHSTVY